MGKIAICLMTYARTEYAVRTLRSTLDHIKYADQISVHIADDGSKPEHRSELYDLAGGYARVQGVSVSNSERGGYGRNYNLATQAVHGFADYVLMLEDDWQLLRALDLDLLVAALDAGVGIDAIRLGYLSFTQALIGQVVNVPPSDEKYLLLAGDSLEPHVFAGHPRLEKVSYQKRVGPWPEGLLPGQTEFAVAHNIEARMGVAWPMDFMHSRGDLFAHIGTTRSY